jgi:hypothetical protein
MREPVLIPLEAAAVLEELAEAGAEAEVSELELFFGAKFAVVVVGLVVESVVF